MVYGFIKQSNGHIVISSKLEIGTTVTLYLPQGKGVHAQEATQTARKITGGSEHILVVEDQAEVRAAIVQQLQRLGYTVSEAADGTKALAAFDAAEGQYDLLLTDVVMPGQLNGKALAEEVTRRWPKACVLFMSGYSENVIAHQGHLDPEVCLLTKPFRKADIALAVRQAIGAASSAPSKCCQPQAGRTLAKPPRNRAPGQERRRLHGLS